ncbi:Bacterioferritin (cytochrome b1) (Bfr) (PDB:4E6K) [Commensalibacter communis]|uniref:Bacterioferritin n=1 Tax=Commensalibacter communis TaxID=2972786 RepID=A0A9W4TMR5_9PROT|nr:bacterioferritin [Commensalibacter communis]CAI3925340.1 Bacterioferritin (cytochrome b1) (Bfr) (PDB:4E6K) [Commensalibacter communis]CAI3927992.1 Bacterioferritin (cytochrome b1) (Bfr) (PDB:4E6K) [Commensalibacter communis]CAI3929499.1 Bacterioferritin (cytochrome b1) (Bfr) (PDB:4E6K) [Commensalibacter communis]CAI3929512.1 Bacterioferritin (cytochrome b1) (Bfr) (PDB:4E6K) [Commensalibacter communis]CAI3933000.1 Bacterioferritin (cytochrome b1) (Bfr) (PDB:4E6K) [Commensalibacter communis]
MIKDKKVIEFLNIQLTNELTAINQYFLHSRTLNHWGVTKLGKKEYVESIEEMKHADEIIERILMLDGLPNMQRLNTIQIGENVEEMLRSDLAMEQKATKDLREGIAYCESVRDFVTRDLFLSILDAEEEHIDFIDKQFDLIKRMGLENYINLNSDSADQE